MDTPTHIGLEIEPNCIKYVSCHRATQPIGQLLEKHYNYYWLIIDLLNQGDIMKLNTNLENTLFYHRDHKQHLDETTARLTQELNDFTNYPQAYLMTLDRKWKKWVNGQLSQD